MFPLCFNVNIQERQHRQSQSYQKTAKCLEGVWEVMPEAIWNHRRVGSYLVSAGCETELVEGYLKSTEIKRRLAC